MRRTCLMLALGLACAAPQAAAQPYPSRPITMVVPFAAGAPVDTVGRLIAERMRMPLGQPIILENVSGAAGSLDMARAARAAPDGYTIVLATSVRMCSTAPYTHFEFDALKDFEPVALLASQPTTDHLKKCSAGERPEGPHRVAEGRIPTRRQQGLVAQAAWRMSAACSSREETGTRFQFVPYRGTNLAQQIDRRADRPLDQAVSALTNVKAGKIRAYAVTAKTRLGSAPDIPTVDEAGLPGFYMSVWNALWVPKGTPKDIIYQAQFGRHGCDGRSCGLQTPGRHGARHPCA